MPDYPAIPKPTVNFNDYLKMVNNPDGSVTRPITLPTTAASPDHTSRIPVLSKDVSINPDKNIWVRIFLPREARDTSPPAAGAARKLPLIVYFHGGGFVICSAADTVFHDHCAHMAAEIGAVVVSVEYRLAPEHRLPAAYEDGVEALHWIKSSGEAWVSEHADVSRCFLMGSSAGANLAYFTGIRVADSVGDLEPLKIGGLILHHPFFGGIQRTGSEVRLENNGVLPLCATDLAWQLSLPEGVDRDHEYSNPMAKKASEHCSKIERVGWKLLVTGCEGDLLHERQVEFVDMLKVNGVEVEAEFVRGDYHVIELFDSSKAKALFGLVKNFMA
ncbi:hypothetical protein PVL29_021189 [Vitis rotundifolia]|uniref:Alpha/beta hydrolase fold-3 domain-containing protein n=1 Tax=Vitis rotundifolia TaxID=103349 RepID=A0AA38YZ60_VITRO|nr:hypothetical protein PVL29_021189 [Vitis rotundifolia]